MSKINNQAYYTLSCLTSDPRLEMEFLLLDKKDWESFTRKYELLSELRTEIHEETGDKVFSEAGYMSHICYMPENLTYKLRNRNLQEELKKKLGYNLTLRTSKFSTITFNSIILKYYIYVLLYFQKHESFILQITKSFEYLELNLEEK